MNRYAYIPLVVALSSCAVLSGGNKKNKKKAPAAAGAAAKPAFTPGKNGVKEYSTVITKEMLTHPGLFTVHSTQDQDTVYFEINKQLLGKEILTINRIRKIGAGMKVYAGEELANMTIFFEKGANETILLKNHYRLALADSTNVIARAVKDANTDPVMAVLPIRAYGKDSASYVVDMTALLKDPNSFVNDAESSEINKFLTVKTMKEHEVTAIRAYPSNVEIAISKNGMATTTMYSKTPVPATLETNTSFIALPDVPMQKRFADERVGYFSDAYVEFSDKQQEVKNRAFINRWRLEPKPEDRERYDRGELVEPAKPILIYIDPATPKQWRKYLIMGINDWQAAFEHAGFKNAISAKEWPENDTSMNIEDVRYSVLKYLPSDISNAYGPNVHDPRSGEILQTNICWYHNIVNLLHDWYMVQAGPNDPKARVATFDEELMGQLIRFVSSHEVGHTLGLRHNFGSSSQTPVDSLRSITYLRKNGHTASIMDYARFNFVAQPEDHIPEELLFPRINAYDKWAIEWGYKLNNATTPEADKKIMSDLITRRLAENNQLWFGDGESRFGDPRCQVEDLGDDAVKANTLGMKNLKVVVAHLGDWTIEEGWSRKNMYQMYEAVISQYMRYVSQVANIVGGVYYTTGLDANDTPSYVPVDKEKQIAAVNFLSDELFKTPMWLVAPDMLNKFQLPYTRNYIEDMQIRAVSLALSPIRIMRLLDLTKRFGPEKTVPVPELLSLIRKEIWSDLSNGKGNIDAYHRNMQKAYIGSLFALTTSNERTISVSEMATVATAEIKVVTAMIRKALPLATDAITKAHLTDLQDRIERLSAITN
ncbi:zinc-dependent metalloprotease [Chitinophaga sp.]|uniref:zinc-dependent metalloprotease n=1 Tax=Chitinophaga sp. TaxID=1869181 RepID=UPI002F9302E6